MINSSVLILPLGDKLRFTEASKRVELQPKSFRYTLDIRHATQSATDASLNLKVFYKYLVSYTDIGSIILPNYLIYVCTIPSGTGQPRPKDPGFVTRYYYLLCEA